MGIRSCLIPNNTMVVDQRENKGENPCLIAWTCDFIISCTVQFVCRTVQEKKRNLEKKSDFFPGFGTIKRQAAKREEMSRKDIRENTIGEYKCRYRTFPRRMVRLALSFADV